MTDGTEPPSWFKKLYSQLSGPVSSIRDQMIEILSPQYVPEISPEIAYKNLEKLEKQCLRMSGMKLDQEIYSLDRAIDSESWIHQIYAGLQNQGTNMVLLHGYGGTSLSYSRLLPGLSKRFCVHALDHLGMGMSSRKQFMNNWTRQETVGYFIDAIENWRKSALKDQNFTLVGHSFGGYMATCYAQKYPDKIQKLILVSPAGMQYGNQQTSKKAWETVSKNSWWIKVAKKAKQFHPTPSDLINVKIIGQKILDLGLGSRFGLSPEQKRAYMNYFKSCCALQPNSENVIYQLFFFPQTRTQYPISKIFKNNKFKFPIDIYFGTRDWMFHQNNLGLLQQKNNNGNKVSMKFIQKSGHQMTFDNPTRLCQQIMKSDIVRGIKNTLITQPQLPPYLQI